MPIKFKTFKTETKAGPQWFWRLVEIGNRTIIAIGGQGFESRRNAAESMENVKDELFRDYVNVKDLVVFRRDELEKLISRTVSKPNQQMFKDIEIGK